MKILRKATGRTLPVHPLVFLNGAVLLGVLFALQEWATVHRWNMHVGLPIVLKAWIVQYLLWALLCWLIWWVLGPRLQRVKLLGMLTGVLPLSITACVLEEMCWVFCFPHLPLSHAPMTYWQHLVFELNAEFVDGVIIFWCVFVLFRAVDYYLRYREKEEAEVRLEAELVQAQLGVLRVNLNPHFLFNTLNSISSLMRSDIAGADIMLEQFSSLLRITLERGDVQLIPLSDEIEFVEMYMAMQNRRFDGRIHQSVFIEPKLHDALVPAMILQPIVENAYRHGLSLLEGPGILEIKASQENGHLKISVLNSGSSLGELSPHKGRGLTNVTNRLRLQYPGEHTFSIKESSPGKVQVSITLPLQLSQSLHKEQLVYGA